MSSKLRRVDNLELLKHKNTKLKKPCKPVGPLRVSTGYATFNPEEPGAPLILCYECGGHALMAKSPHNTSQLKKRRK